MITELPLTNGFYKSESLPVSAQQAINCYVVVTEQPSLVQEYAVGVPGITEVANTTGYNRQGRGFHVMNGVPYSVNGTGLYRVNSDYTVDSLGTIEGSGDVSMADNGTQLCILVPGGKGYIFTESPDTLTEITDVDFRANGDPQAVIFVDGYFLFTTDEKKYIISALNDGLDYNALDFGSAESDPDIVVCPGKYHNQVFIFGGTTIEGQQNIGGSGFPFQRSGLFFDKGAFAAFSVINAQDTLMFVGGGVNETPAIWAITGNSLAKISTNAIDSLLQQLTDAEVSAIRAWTFGLKGSYFVGFALPDTTIVYEMASKKWFEWQSYLNSSLGMHRVHSMVTAYGEILCNDVIDGRFGVISPDVYTEYGANIVRRIVTMPFANRMVSLFFPMLELTVESGMGNLVDTYPVVVLERSTDGGKTWSNGRSAPIGAIGEYNKRALWYRNGRAARFECFRFTCGAKIKFVAIGLRADIREGLK